MWEEEEVFIPTDSYMMSTRDGIPDMSRSVACSLRAVSFAVMLRRTGAAVPGTWKLWVIEKFELPSAPNGLR